MKRPAILMIVGCAVFSLMTGVNAYTGPVKGHGFGPVARSTSAAVLGVDQFMTNVSQYRGPVIIEGVVSGVFPKHRMVALIDTNEFKACGVTTCARLTLPVQWTGRMPKIKDTVRVEGQVRQVQQKMVFVARQLTRVEPKKVR